MKLSALLPPVILGVASTPFVFAAVDVDVDVSSQDAQVEAEPSQDIDAQTKPPGDTRAGGNSGEGDVIAADDIGESAVEPDANSPPDGHLPSALLKAARVGAKLREARRSKDEGIPDEADGESEMESPNTNAVDTANNPKPPLTGCAWGAMGCKKGKMGAGAGPGDINASAADDDGESEDIKSPSSTSFAGSANRRIEAHLKGRGTPLGKRRKPSAPDDGQPIIRPNPSTFGSGHKPPQGFKLAGRIVTSPSDGLSYFLDSPQVDPEDSDGEWMMTIPYAYLECGPTIESTTEPFSLTDMALRHFPAAASVEHWANLGGGVTIETGDADEALGEESGPKYIEGNREGHPKLLVALSPIKITVSGNDEESRIFAPGEVILMEDTLGKGHKMNAAHVDHETHGRDLSVLMVSLPHTVHYPAYDGLEGSSYSSEGADEDEDDATTTEPMHGAPADSLSSSPPTSSYGAEHALFGFGPKHLHQKPRSLRKQASLYAEMRKPCPLEYDSAYSSLFTPAHNPYRTLRHSRRSPRWSAKDEQLPKESSFDEVYHPPPGFSTYEKHPILFDYLPSLRRTMLFGLGLSMTSSFIYCVQLLYPPLLVLWGGATMVIGGSLLSVLAARRGYRNWVANWEEEWRWKREVKRNRMHKEEMVQERAEEIIRDEMQYNSENDENETTDAEYSDGSTKTERSAES